MGISTGTPGFDIDGKSYTYDVGDPNTTPENYPIPSESGDIDIDKSVKDISKTTKKTLADYLSKKTSVNEFPVDVISIESTVTGINNTTPVIDVENPTENTEYFPKGYDLDVHGISTQSPLKQWMIEGYKTDKVYHNPIETLQSSFVKGKAKKSSTQIDGNDLLPQVNGGPTNNETAVAAKYSSAVLNNNRFTAKNPYLDDQNSELNEFNPILYSPKIGNFTSTAMSKVGISLSLRASQELNATSNDYNPTSAGSEAAALLPGFNQLGAGKISNVVLTAKDVLQNLAKEGISEELASQRSMISVSDSSWGSLNNVFDPYTGLSAVGMIGLSLALSAAVTTIYESIGTLLSFANSDTSVAHDQYGRYALGSSTYYEKEVPGSIGGSLTGLASNFSINKMLGINPTVMPFAKCLNTGVLAFFQMDTEGGIGSVVSSAIESSVDSPGYYSIVARSIIRSATALIEKFSNLGKSVNMVSGVKGVLDIIESFRTSKIISAFNIFAMLGDAILSANKDAPKDVDRPISMSNRIEPKTLKLKWAQNQSPSLYLLPKSIVGMQAAMTNFGSSNSGYGMQEAETRSYYHIINSSATATSGSRIPYDNANGKSDSIDELTVKNIETQLEAAYVPFYFHDLRTNEIISFHAFIDSMSDSFSMGSESSTGFGRIEPVKIYKETTRSISLSFVIVATSKPDFDEMWVKINKLVTLVYPQYTEGRRLRNGDNYNFVQPFSQMVSSSPLIRLRLGDIFSSNYSKFNLARLFGSTLGDTQFGTNGATTDKFENVDHEKIMSTMKSIRSVTSDKKWIVTSGLTYDQYKPSGDSSIKWVTNADSNFIPVKIVDIIDDNRVAISPEMPDGSFISSEIGSINSDEIIKSVSKYNNSNDPKNYIVGKKFIINKEQLKPTKETIQKIMNESNSSDASDVVTDLANFMSANNNAIVKSFKSTAGKGLAGMINNLQFDWMGASGQWETQQGSKAPMSCKVSIDFSPIHDITPGIDSQGYNRAPVYPVGFMKQGSDSDL